jgi:hypothetical protein
MLNVTVMTSSKSDTCRCMMIETSGSVVEHSVAVSTCETSRVSQSTWMELCRVYFLW